MIFKDKGILKAMWGGMFFLCALLGFVPEQEGANEWLLTGLGVLFFLPPLLLLLRCRHSADRKGLALIRNLSLLSLGSTLLVLILNLLSLLFPQWLGNLLHYLLILVSTPMICSQYWIISLFLWAMLLWGSLFSLKSLQK